MNRFISITRLVKHTLVSMFPSPLEVNRFISEINHDLFNTEDEALPSPFEVDRVISENPICIVMTLSLFPSPLEVYRFISYRYYSVDPNANTVSVPSRGELGYIQQRLICSRN